MYFFSAGSIGFLFWICLSDNLWLVYIQVFLKLAYKNLCTLLLLLLEIWPCSGSWKNTIDCTRLIRVAVLQRCCLSTLESFDKLTLFTVVSLISGYKFTVTSWWFTLHSCNPYIIWFLIHLKCVVSIVCRITSGMHVLLIYNIRCLILT